MRANGKNGSFEPEGGKRKQMADAGEQRAEGRCRRAESRGQMTEDRGGRREAGNQAQSWGRDLNIRFQIRKAELEYYCCLLQQPRLPSLSSYFSLHKRNLCINCQNPITDNHFSISLNLEER
jgi:hypothetical protein